MVGQVSIQLTHFVIRHTIASLDSLYLGGLSSLRPITIYMNLPILIT